MVDGRKRSERLLVFKLAVVAAAILIYLFTLLLKSKATFIEVCDEITTFLNRLDIALTRLLH